MRAKLTIGPEGQLAVPPRQAESLGLAGGGDVDVLSARGACALVVPARADSPKAWFAGALASLTVAEVVQFVLSSLKTGTLLLAFGGEAEREARAPGPERLRRTSVYFKDGQVVFASSSDPAHRLGASLVRGGFAGEAEVERCAALVRSGHPLGQVLVDEGIVTSAQVYEALAAQVREIFLAAFTETAGDFAFLEGAVDEANQIRLPQRMRDLVLEGMKRVEAAELERAAAPWYSPVASTFTRICATSMSPSSAMRTPSNTARRFSGSRSNQLFSRAAASGSTFASVAWTRLKIRR